MKKSFYIIRSVLFFILFSFQGSAVFAELLSDTARYIEDETLNSREIDPNPEGKIITDIVIQRADPFISDKWYINFPNYLHTTTRERVILRELLVNIGDPYQAELVEESARTIRSMRIMHDCQMFALVNPDDPETVTLYIETRDSWSLNIDLHPALEGNKFDFSIHATERNVAGFAKALAVKYHIDNFLQSIELVYNDSRFLDSKYSLDISGLFGFQLGNAYFDGYLFSFDFSMPMRTVFDDWYFSIYSNIENRTQYVFNYSSGDLDTFTIPPTGITGQWETWALSIDTGIEKRYLLESYEAGFDIEKAFGTYIRAVVGTGYVYRYQTAEYHNEITDNYGYTADEMIEYFKNEFFHTYDYSEFKIYAGFEIIDYVEMTGFNSFDRTEDIKIGFRFVAGNKFSHKYLGAMDDHEHYAPFLELFYGLYHEPYILFLISSEASTRIIDKEYYESTFEMQIQLYILELPFGQLAYQIQGAFKNKNASGLSLRNGGEISIRGYQPNTFEGNRILVSNVEIRSLPLNVYDLFKVAAVLFYDVGNSWDGSEIQLKDVKFYNSIGLGLRTAIAFLSPNVLRLDFGFGLNELIKYNATTAKYTTKKFNFTFTFAYGQSF